MKISVIGGGPGGLYFALLTKKRRPDIEIDVFEQNRADDTFGFGVVFSDETLDEFLSADPESYELIRDSFAYWTDIVVDRHGRRTVIGGNGFAGCSRMTLLTLLQQRCRDVGVNMHFETRIDVDRLEERFADSDLIVEAGGVNSPVRDRYREAFGATVTEERNKFAWLGSATPLDAFTFFFRETEHGLICAHTYQYEEGRSTWVIETTPECWQASGFGELDEEANAAALSEIFADELKGHPLIPSGRGRYLKYARGLASELLELRAEEALKISHFLHLRAEVCSETLEEEMSEFGKEDRVGIVSLMDHTPGQRQFRDITKLADYMKGKHGLSDAEFAEHVAQLKELRDAHGDRHEAYAVEAAKRYGAVLASHDDTTESQVVISEGYGVAMAEFPTTEEAAEACHARGIAVIMGAPNLIRGGSHSGNVAAGVLAEKGHLDILSSDYVPSALLLSAVKLGQDWDDMARGLATVTAAPAKAVGLDDRGAVAVGKRADLIRFVLRGGVPALRAVWGRGHRVA